MVAHGVQQIGARSTTGDDVDVPLDSEHPGRLVLEEADEGAGMQRYRRIEVHGVVTVVQMGVLAVVLLVQQPVEAELFAGLRLGTFGDVEQQRRIDAPVHGGHDRGAVVEAAQQFE